MKTSMCIRLALFYIIKLFNLLLVIQTCAKYTIVISKVYKNLNFQKESLLSL